MPFTLAACLLGEWCYNKAYYRIALVMDLAFAFSWVT